MFADVASVGRHGAFRAGDDEPFDASPNSATARGTGPLRLGDQHDAEALARGGSVTQQALAPSWAAAAR